MYVNPLANYFYTWGTTAPTTTPVTDAILNSNGTNNYGYYVYIVNPDGQHYMTNLSTKITHASYTFTFGSYQNTVSNTQFGKPTNATLYCYQDGSVTNSATSNSGTYAEFVDWMEGSTSIGGVATNQTFSGTSDRTIKCRYTQYLYYNGTQVIPWFMPSYTDDPYEFSASQADSGYNWIMEYGKGKGKGEVGASTTAIDLTNCSTVGICWKQTDSSGQYATLSIRDQSGGNRTSGTNLCDRNTGGSWGPAVGQWESFPIPVGQQIANMYIRVHAANSRVWTSYLYVQ